MCLHDLQMSIIPRYFIVAMLPHMHLFFIITYHIRFRPACQEFFMNTCYSHMMNKRNSPQLHS
jgi:hypothetical protein